MAYTERSDAPSPGPTAPDVVRSLIDDLARAERIARVFKAIANPTRLRILAYLAASEERNVGEVSRMLDLPQAITSQHLAALRMEGLVRVRRAGGYRYYSISVPQIRVLLQCIAGTLHEGSPETRSAF